MSLHLLKCHIVGNDMSRFSCADPESFVRGGPNVITLIFFVDVGIEVPNTTKLGHHPLASKRPLKWRFAGGQMMAQH